MSNIMFYPIYNNEYYLKSSYVLQYSRVLLNKFLTIYISIPNSVGVFTYFKMIYV